MLKVFLRTPAFTGKWLIKHVLSSEELEAESTPHGPLSAIFLLFYAASWWSVFSRIATVTIRHRWNVKKKKKRSIRSDAYRSIVETWL